MATVDATRTTKSGKHAAAAPLSLRPRPCTSSFPAGGDLALRALLFAVTLAGLVVVATAEQAVLRVQDPQISGLVVSSLPAKFEDSPALIYLLVALCVTCFHSLLTALTSLVLLGSSHLRLVSHKDSLPPCSNS